MMLPELQKRFMIILSLVLVVTNFMPYSPALGEEVLKIGGVGSALGSMKLLGAVFEKSHPDVKVEVLPSLGSAGAIKAVAKGAIDLGLSGRPIKDEESKLGLSVNEYARTPFIFVTRKDVNISGVTIKEIIKIYRGETETWPDGKRIRLVLRPSEDSDTLIVKKISPEMSKAVETALSRPGMMMVLTDQENADIMGKTQGAFGFSTLTQVIAEKRPLKILSYNGVTPGVKTLANGSYPLFKPLFIVTKPEPSELVQKFIDFVRSAEGSRILEESGNLVITDKSGH